MILAGGFSDRFGQNKALIKLVGKPLILHVLDNIAELVDDIVVVVSSDSQRREFGPLLAEKAMLIVDSYSTQSPLVGALTGFENVDKTFSLLLPCDTALVSSRALSFLLDLCIDRNAVIPRWPNDYIEPLQAVYRTDPALHAAQAALKDRRFDLHSMILHMKQVRYVSTTVLQQLNRGLLTFFNINTPQDLERAESLYFSQNPCTDS